MLGRQFIRDGRQVSNPQQYPFKPGHAEQTEGMAAYGGHRPAPQKKGPHWGAIAGLIVGILALFGAMIPILGGPIGLVMGAIATILSLIGLKGAKGMAIVALIISLIAFLIGIFNIQVTSDAFGSDTVTSVGAGGGPSVGGGEAKTAFSAGETADIEGLQISVSVPKQVRDSGQSYICSDVNYVNNSNKERSFNGGFDWKMQDPDDVIALVTTRFGGIDKSLKSGSLAPGGKVAGEVCFNAPSKKGSIKIINKETWGNTEVTWAANLK